MRGIILFCICCTCVVFARPALAGDCWQSEVSHVAGGAALAGAVTAGADRYWPEHRAMIGFAASTAAVVATEGREWALGEKFSSAMLDVASHTIGAALGSFVTDKYILMPVVRVDRSNNVTVGFLLQAGF